MPQTPPDPLVVETAYGAVRGFTRDSARIWLGIPYALGPSGRNRWQAPMPPQPWEGIRECSQFGNIAVQPPTPMFPNIDGVEMDEDCLTLNIWSPTSTSSTSRPRPVMVWIHGGGYLVGASAQPVYDGQALASRGDVVVVTLNYRLGALGFLDFGFLDTTDHRFATNAGLRDIVAGLEWVRDNIAAFGGDPNDVTVFGQSAGAACITTLMTMPSTRGLFHRAIAQSPPATSVYDRDRAQAIARFYLEILGSDAGAAIRADQLLEISAPELTEPTVRLLYRVATEQPGILAFSPVVDGEFVPEHPIDVFRAGEQHPIPLLIGSTRDEARLFAMLKSPLMPTTTDAVRQMFANLAADQPEVAAEEAQIVSAYPRWPSRRAAINVSSDAGIRMPVTWIAEAHSAIAPTFVYRFDQATPFLKLAGLGAIHASELAYVFGNVPRHPRLNKRQMVWLGGTRRARRVSERLQGHWLTFAARSNPNWPLYTRDERQTLIVDGRDEVRADPDRRQRQAWGDEVTSFR